MRIQRFLALLFVLLLSASACAPSSGTTEFTRYPRTSITTEATGFYPSGISSIESDPACPLDFDKMIQYSTFIFDAELLYEKKTMSIRDPIRMVFGINRELKGVTEWNEPEITVEMQTRLALSGSTRYLLFVYAYERAAVSEPIIQASFLVPLSDDGEVRLDTWYYSSAFRYVPQSSVDDLFENMGERFYKDPFGVVLDSPSIHEGPVEVYEKVPESYPDTASLCDASDLILVANLVESFEQSWNSPVTYFSKIVLSEDPLKTDSSGTMPRGIQSLYQPDEGTQYVLFLRRLETIEDINPHYDLVARNGALIEKDEIPDWEAFAAQVQRGN